MDASRLAMLMDQRNQQQGPPQATTVHGNPHMLAYITPEEAYILRNRGGGLGIGGGQLVQDGIPAFEDGMAEGNRGGGDGGEFSMGAGWGGDGTQMAADGGRAEGNQGAIGAVSGDLSNADFGGRTGVATDSVSRGGGVMGVEGSVSNDASDGNFGGKAGTESSSVSNDGFQGGSLDKGFLGGAANYGQEGGFSGGGGSEAATSSSGQIAQANPPPAPAVPAGPTPEELAERERLRLKALADEAERLVRARYDSSLGNTWRDALVNKFNTEAQGELDTAYGSNRTGIIEALRAAGYEATPLATAKLAGLDTQKTREAGLIPTTRTSRFTDVDARRNASLVEAIRLAREQAPSWANLATSANSLADTNINAYLTALQTNPGAVYKPNFTATSATTETGPTAPQATAAEAFRNALLTVRNPAAAARVA